MEPRARIEAFLADYAAAHAEALPLIDVCDESSRPVIFRVWGEKLHDLDVAHRAGEPFSGGSGGFSSQSAFSPETVTIERIDVYGTSAMARLARSGVSGAGGDIIEMTLVRVDGDWRIDTIRDYYDEPGSPLVPEAERRERLRKALWVEPFGQMRPDRPVPGDLFVTGRGRLPVDEYELASKVDEKDEEAWAAALAEARRNAETVKTEVWEVGRFPQGGQLAVGDASSLNMMYVCALGLEPSEARAQAVVVRFDEGGLRVAAVRAVLGEAEPVRWRRAVSVPAWRRIPSTLITDSGVGVDSGTAAIVDAEGYLSMTHRQWTSAWASFGLRKAGLFDGGSGPVGVITSSGWGDGCYGVFWGLDGGDRPVQLVIDYGVLGQAPVPAAQD